MGTLPHQPATLRFFVCSATCNAFLPLHHPVAHAPVLTQIAEVGETPAHPLPLENWRERAPVRYASALIITLLAVAIRLSLNPFLKTDYPYALFYPLLMIAAVTCGFGPALLSTALMAGAAVLWLLPRPPDSADVLGLLLFVTSALTMSIIGYLYRRSRTAGKLVEMFRQEATQRKRAEQTLRQAQDDLAEDLQNTRRLHDLAIRFVTHHDLDHALNEMLEAAMEITHSNKGTLQFFDPATCTLRIRAAKGLSNEWLAFFHTIHGEGATCGEAMRTRERVIVPDVRLSPIFAGTPSLSVQLQEGVLAVQSTPLISRSGEFLGMISTHFAEPHTPKDRELHWMDLLARQAADLIERSRSLHALRESEQLLRTVATQARVGLAVLDSDRRYVFTNQTYLNLHGLPPSSVNGKRVPDVIGALYDQVKPNLDRAFQGQRVTYEVRMPPRDNSSNERFFEVICEPRADDTGTLHVVAVMVDVTERTKMQQTLEQTVEQRTEKLRDTIHELEAFSYSIAHDMRAPLRAMQGFAKILEEDYGHQLDHQGREHLRRIGFSTRRLDALIQDVLNYSRIVRSDLPLQSVQTNEFVHQIIESYPNLQPHRAEIHIQEPMPPVLANPAAFTQVVSNLLGNAVKFTRPGIKPDVHVRAEILSKHSPAGGDDDEQKLKIRSPNSSEPTPNDRIVRLWFEDNGIGIRKELYDRIFLMFQRINPSEEYEGTGMGLTIVRKAVERMGGAVGLESEPGKGSRFWIDLPKAA